MCQQCHAFGPPVREDDAPFEIFSALGRQEWAKQKAIGAWNRRVT